MKKWVKLLEVLRPFAQKAGQVWLFLFDMFIIRLKKIWFKQEGKALEEKAKSIRDAAVSLESTINSVESRRKTNK